MGDEVNKRVVLIYSGGSDSYTLLHYLLATHQQVLALSFDYGQRHRVELSYARAECARAGVAHTIVDAGFLRAISRASALTSTTPVPEGFYESDTMRQTVVPNRNMILLSIAAAFALNNGCSSIAYGAHAGDHAIYADCRPAFVHAMQDVLYECDEQPVKLLAPFIGLDKRGIYRWGIDRGLDYARSWTCYKGGELACGKCGACVERLHAFYDIGVVDPAPYADREYFKTVIR